MKRLFGLAVAVVGCAVAWLVWPSEQVPAARLQFAPGSRYVYALHLSGQSSVVMAAGAQPMSGGFELDGELLIDGREGAIDVSFARLERAEMTLLGQKGDERPVLEGHVARVALDASGRLGTVELEASDPLVFKNTVQMVLGELQLQGDREHTLRGEAVVASQAFPAGIVEKARTRYLAVEGLGAISDPLLDARAFFTFAPSGQLVRVDSRERIEAGHSHAALWASLSLKSIGTVPPAAVADRGVAQRVAPATIVPDPDAERSLLTQQLDGLTVETLAANLDLYAIGAPIPRHNHFLVQAVALLTLHPELCEVIGARAADPGNTSRGRSLALDLLANAGTAAAQVALVAAIGSEAVQTDPRFALLTFRLAMVRQPTEQTVEVVDAAFLRSADAERHDVLAVSLGALAGARLRREDSVAARSALEHLREDLKTATEPRRTVSGVTALGNAGRPEDVPLLETYARVSDSGVRRAVAEATRKMASGAAQQLALSLATDADARVQQAALGALERYPLDGGPLRTLRDDVLAGRVAKESFNALVTALAPYAAAPDARAVLEYLARPDVPVVDMELKTRARNLLQRS